MRVSQSAGDRQPPERSAPDGLRPERRSLAAQEAEPSGLRALLPAALLLLAGLSGLLIATLFSDGVEGQFVVISPPWQPVTEVVARADGMLLAGGGFSNVMVAASERPGFVDDLRAGGAWLVFPAPRFLGCTTPQQAGTL